MIIGFTGTRNALTGIQLRNLITGLMMLGESWEGLHGDCIGADAAFDAACKELGMVTKCRPCNFDNMRAYCTEAIAEPTNPMARNRLIAADCDRLFACPPNEEELKKGSGTWATIRYGGKADKIVTVFYPSGKVDFDYWRPEQP